MRLHARRHRRLVRRRRPRQVRRQRRHLGGPADEHVGAQPERPLHRPPALGDSTLPLPERGNGVPDVLDEARWELEWMLTMQVPAGEPLAGMVHHKVHDNEWTGLPLDPAADDKVRELHRPSTAATLNLAAVAAQGARIFERYDRPFAGELLAAARRAWTAAERQPGALRPGRRRQLRRRAVRRLERDRRVLLGRGRALRDDRRAAVQAGRARLAAPRAGPVPGRRVRLADDGAARPASTWRRSPNGLPERWRIRSWVLEGADAILALQDAAAVGPAVRPGDATSGRGARRPRSSTTWSCWRRPTTSRSRTGTATA